MEANYFWGQVYFTFAERVCHPEANNCFPDDSLADFNKVFENMFALTRSIFRLDVR